MKPDDVIALLCPRVADRPKAPMPGAQTRVCSVCSAMVWLAPSSLPLEEKSVIFCLQCTPAPTLGTEVMITEGQLEEIRERTGDPTLTAEKLFAQIRENFRKGSAS